MTTGKNYRYLFFDLDGTLMKSGEGIERCAQQPCGTSASM